MSLFNTNLLTKDETSVELANRLAERYKYKKLSTMLSPQVRDKYYKDLPEVFNINGDPDFEIISKSGSLIAKGYEAIVIGDYGAYLEIKASQVISENIKCKPGEEYRKKLPSVKYWWYTTKDDSDVKLYYQKRTVDYADYKVGYVYVSPFELEH